MLADPCRPQDAFLVASAGEFALVHPSHDGSLHLALPIGPGDRPDREGLGRHAVLAGVRLIPRMVLLFEPRDGAESETVTEIVVASHAWASGRLPAERAVDGLGLAGRVAVVTAASKAWAG